MTGGAGDSQDTINFNSALTASEALALHSYTVTKLLPFITEIFIVVLKKLMTLVDVIEK